MDELIKLFNNTYEIAKSLKKLNDSIKDTTVRTLILSLNEMLIDLKEQILNNKTEMLEYKEKISELQKQLELKEEMVFDKVTGCMYKKEDVDKTTPFCPSCLSEKGQLNNMVKYIFNRFTPQHRCVVCEKKVNETNCK